VRVTTMPPMAAATAGAVCRANAPGCSRWGGVALILTGVVVAVTGRTPQAAYSRRKTRIIRHAPDASTGKSPSKSP